MLNDLNSDNSSNAILNFDTTNSEKNYNVNKFWYLNPVISNYEFLFQNNVKLKYIGKNKT